MTSYAYIFEILCENVAVDLRLNDWLAYHVAEPRRRVCQLKVNPWLVEGDNEIVVRLAPLDAPSDAPVCFTFDLLKVERGQPSTDEDALLTYCWTAEESPLDWQGAPTIVFKHEFPMHAAFGRWAWEDAQAYMPSDRASVEALVARFHAAVSDRRVDDVMALLHNKFSEIARSLTASVDDLVERQRRAMEAQLSHPECRVLPLDVTQLELRSSAGGRLVDVLDERGEPPVKVWVGESFTPLGLSVSHIEGAWQVVR